VIGNFPYNISTQILFRVLEYRERIPQVVGMFQEEVAVRIASQPGNRDYGILSVLMQAWYDVTLLLSLPPEAFQPPPKVRSAVIVCRRKTDDVPACDERMFTRVIKAAFNQRRKTLRNALSSLVPKDRHGDLPFLDLRAEALGWKQFEVLTEAVIRALGS
jgi:16S rRNA (adenine1518-N6/adenine1519-N6)-dimethyltransferase